MNVETVQKYISQGEGQCCEFKTSFAEEDEAIRSLCAFTHAQGGNVFWGITDNCKVVGVTIGKNTLENFANKIKIHTQPPLIITINSIKYERKTIVVASIGIANQSQLFYAFNTPYIRISKTNQVMSPEEVRSRLFKGFRAENLEQPHKIKSDQYGSESWEERERKRVRIYQDNSGLFLIHTWRHSSKPGQVADIIIKLWQHGEGPLNQGTIKSVEYHLGSKFFDYTVVKTNRSSNFSLKVSAYGPMLCLAKVNFDDGSPSLNLQRYINF